jgi:hypothetical protein
MKKYQGIIFYDFLFKKLIFGQNAAGAKELKWKLQQNLSPITVTGYRLPHPRVHNEHCSS